MQSLTYCYAMSPPTGAVLLLEAAFANLAALWRTYAAIENQAMVLERGLLHRQRPELLQLTESIAAQRALLRSALPDETPQQRRLRQVSEGRELERLQRLYRREMRACRKLPALQAEIERIEAVRVRRIQAARHASGCWWHHYQWLGNSFQQARVQCRSRLGRFRRPYQSRQVSLTFDRPVTFTALGDGQVPTCRIVLADHGAQAMIAVAPKQAGMYPAVTGNISLHRLPEAGDLVTGVRLRHNPACDKWWFALTLRRTVAAVSKTAGKAGLDFGWRRTPAGLRVCVAALESDGLHELILPNGWIAKWQHLRALHRQLAELQRKRQPVPEKLVREKDGLTRRLRLARANLYHGFFKTVFARADHALMHRLEMQPLAIFDPLLCDQVRSQRWMVGMADIKHIMRHQAIKAGAIIEEDTVPNDGLVCLRCGNLLPREDLAELRKTLSCICPRCGHTWDQDYQAASLRLERLRGKSDARPTAL